MTNLVVNILYRTFHTFYIERCSRVLGCWRCWLPCCLHCARHRCYLVIFLLFLIVDYYYFIAMNLLVTIVIALMMMMMMMMIILIFIIISLH